MLSVKDKYFYTVMPLVILSVSQIVILGRLGIHKTEYFYFGLISFTFNFMFLMAFFFLLSKSIRKCYFFYLWIVFFVSVGLFIPERNVAYFELINQEYLSLVKKTMSIISGYAFFVATLLAFRGINA